MKKRILCLSLALVMVLLMLPTAAAAGTELTVKTPAELPKAGEKFTVAVDISGNPGIASAQFTLAYNKSLLRCESAEVGTSLSGMLSATNPDAAKGAIIAAAATSNVKKDGTIGVYTFTAKKNLTAWDLKLLDVMFNNENGANIAITSKTADGEMISEPVDEEPEDILIDEPEDEPAVEESESVIEFRDMNGHWGKDFVRRAVELGLFTGYPDGTFRPDTSISRAEFVTVLWRSAGSPEPTKPAAFTDVPANQYYSKAVAWAKENNYVSGTSATTFNPTGLLKRQEAMKILFYYCGGQSGLEILLTSTYDRAFVDSNKIASWAKAPMYWAYYNGIISGAGNNRLNPTSAASRAEIAKILVNILDKQS